MNGDWKYFPVRYEKDFHSEIKITQKKFPTHRHIMRRAWKTNKMSIYILMYSHFVCRWSHCWFLVHWHVAVELSTCERLQSTDIFELFFFFVALFRLKVEHGDKLRFTCAMFFVRWFKKGKTYFATLLFCNLLSFRGKCDKRWIETWLM
jgi:hypothetical protein